MKKPKSKKHKKNVSEGLKKYYEKNDSSKKIKFSKTELNFILLNNQLSYRKLVIVFNKQFNKNISVGPIKGVLKNERNKVTKNK